MLLPPTDLALGEAYLRDDFDIEGNLEEATKLVDFISTRLRSPTLLARVVRGLRKLPSDDLSKNDSTRFPNATLGADSTPEGVMRQRYALITTWATSTTRCGWIDEWCIRARTLIRARRISMLLKRPSWITPAASSG